MDIVEVTSHSRKACYCESCKKARKKYYNDNKEKIIEKKKTSNLTPEQREIRNIKRMERYYRDKELKKQTSVTAQ